MQGNFTYLVIAVCILLALGFAWQEYRRVNKRNLLLRVLAVLLAAASLACIALPIKYTGSVTKTGEHNAILLTDGFNTDSVNADSNILTTDAAIKKAYPKARLINGLDELSQTDKLHIYGYGLNDDELAQLDSLPIMFHPANPAAGVSHINWNGRIKAGEALHVQGIYNNTSAQKVKLVLRGLNTGLDSVTLPPNTRTNFDLKTTPKTTGKVVFTLHADTSLQGSIPLEITPVKPLKVLMLSASPDFESKFLKNWLTENGYAVALRAAISKGKFNSEYINIVQLSLDKLSSQTFEKFDVLIGDLSVLNALSPAETGALKQEVADKGLGLIVRADSTGKASWLQKQFPVDKPSGREPAPAALIINSKNSVSKLNYGLAHIIYQNGTQPLVKTAQGRVLVNSAISGSGKIVFTALGNTFSWTLSGNKQDYSAFWSVLVTRAARKDGEVQNSIGFLSLPYVNEPAQLNIASAKTSSLLINRQTTASAQNPNVPFEYSAAYWPATVGWQNVEQNGMQNSWYAYAKNDWAAVQATGRISATKKYADVHKITDIVTKQIQQKVRIDVPKIYFYILLLAACTFLWVETKFS
ncbi:hypothetical protein EWM62_16920 [Mucilaginibacter terrigena]|uniref:Uncharacterized protein n=1 Tax=Mucilaginibacter terrigena TaxID=2492395 RepID=A0A4Q5LJA3_9SPHI|nr:hypothetical protein [Mucilaginibacter terrigena]RYU86834.1 hypothetical protein EWM62_16920 [Mucilaginibacter terrigena]